MDAASVGATEDVDMESTPPALAANSARNMAVARIPLALAAKGTWEFPAMVPMENKFLGNRYYVRECYPEYYQLVMDMLCERSGVAITGTPGIGKSVFMAYFFERYSEDHPNATVIMLSYNKKSELRKVVVSRGGHPLERALFNQARMEEIVGRHMEESIGKARHEAIMLLDGPPKMIPEAPHWVSFSSPNEGWLDQIRKSGPAYYEMFMPTWTLPELRVAANLLHQINLEQEASDAQLRSFGIDPATESTPRRLLVDVCFDVFGGVPRSCFFGNDKDLGAAFTSISNAVGSLTLDQIWKAVTGQVAKEQVHQLFHYVPEERPYVDAHVCVGSDIIERLVVKREEAIISDNQGALENMLDGVKEGRSLMGYLFEARTQRLLVNGCTIDARKLSEDVDEPLSITTSGECKVGRVTNKFDIEPLNRSDPLVALPSSKNLASIDGFYWQPEENNGRVVLFQVTVSQHHPVKAHGLYQALKKLQLWESYQACPDDTVAALVFVVPSARAGKDKFKKQRIEIVAPLKDSSSVKDIDGVGQAMATRLAPFNIGTVGELRNFQNSASTGRSRAKPKVDKKLIYEAQKMLKEHEQRDELLAQIPQYVWGI